MPSIIEVVEDYVAICDVTEGTEAPARWHWAGELSALLDSLAGKDERTKTSEEIGRKIGESLGRKPYSGCWVRMQVSAFKKFASCPSDSATCRAFLSACNGNAARDAQKAAQTSSVTFKTRSPLERLQRALEACKKANVETEVILTTVQTSLDLSQLVSA